MSESRVLTPMALTMEIQGAAQLSPRIFCLDSMRDGMASFDNSALEKTLTSHPSVPEAEKKRVGNGGTQ